MQKRLCKVLVTTRDKRLCNQIAHAIQGRRDLWEMVCFFEAWLSQVVKEIKNMLCCDNRNITVCKTDYFFALRESWGQFYMLAQWPMLSLLVWMLWCSLGLNGISGNAFISIYFLCTIVAPFKYLCHLSRLVFTSDREGVGIRISELGVH